MDNLLAAAELNLIARIYRIVASAIHFPFHLVSFCCTKATLITAYRPFNSNSSRANLWTGVNLSSATENRAASREFATIFLGRTSFLDCDCVLFRF